MKIVIPTAGLGTRMRPHTWSKPKPLINVAGKPVLGHVMDMFEKLPDIDEIVFIIGYLGDQIEAYISQAYPSVPSRFVVQEEMLGQSHAIWLAREGLEGRMLMLFVDTLIDPDLSFLRDEKAEGIAWVKEVPDPRRFGVVQLDDEGSVTRLIEKPDDMSNNLAVVGLYYFAQAERLIAAIEGQMEQGTALGGEFYLADAINVMLDDGLQMRTETTDVWMDAGKPDALLETNAYFLGHGRDNTEEAASREGVTIVPPVYIDPSAAVERSVIGPNVSLGPKCAVSDSRIRNSIVEAEAVIEASVLEGSLIGVGARVAGRFRSLNLGDTSAVE